MNKFDIFTAITKYATKTLALFAIISILPQASLIQAQSGEEMLRSQSEYLVDIIRSYAAGINSVSSSLTGHTLSWRTSGSVFFPKSIFLPIADIDPDRISIDTVFIGENSSSTVLIYTIDDAETISIQRFDDNGDPVDDGSSMESKTQLHFPNSDGRAFAEFFVEELKKAISLAQQ